MRAVVVVVGLVLAGVASPATAAPQGTITLQGNTSAWAMIDIPRDVTIDARGITATGGGRFGGFYVDFGGQENLGAVWLRDYHMPGEPGGHVSGLDIHSGNVSRGRYRIYLVADGPMTVRIPVTGMTSRTLRPTNRTTASVSVQHLPVRGFRVEGRQPVTAAKRSVSFSSILIDDTQVMVGSIAVCLTKPEGYCDSGGWDNARHAFFVSPQGPYTFGFTIMYSPGVKAGRFDAVQSAENVAGIKHAVGASFTLALV